MSTYIALHEVYSIIQKRLFEAGSPSNRLISCQALCLTTTLVICPEWRSIMSSSVTPETAVATAGAVSIATAAVAVLTYRTAKMCRTIVSKEGIEALLTYENTGQLLMHLSLLFAWRVFVDVSIGVLRHGDSFASMVGFGGLLAGFSVMRIRAMSAKDARPQPEALSRGDAV
jgi:hypothetical protein